MRKRSGKIFFFFFFCFSNTWIFRKIGQSFLCFSDFPKFTKPDKSIYPRFYHWTSNQFKNYYYNIHSGWGFTLSSISISSPQNYAGRYLTTRIFDPFSIDCSTRLLSWKIPQKISYNNLPIQGNYGLQKHSWVASSSL